MIKPNNPPLRNGYIHVGVNGGQYRYNTYNAGSFANINCGKSVVIGHAASLVGFKALIRAAIIVESGSRGIACAEHRVIEAYF